MKFSKEQKQQLVARYQNGESVTNICLETGISRSTFYSWIKLFQTQVTKSGMVVSPQEFFFLRKHVNKLEETIAVLKAAECTASAPLQAKLKALEKLYGQYSIHTLCDALDVPRGTFYNHVLRNKKENKSYQFRRIQLAEQIKQVYDESNQIFGARKIKAVLADRGIATSVKMVSELMQEMNLTSIRIGAKANHLKFTPVKKTDKLKMEFSASAPNQVWVSDVTYFKLNNKVYYICAIIDLYSRKAIAYKISLKHSTQLITSTFRAAYKDRKPTKGLIFHSDRGPQYTSHAFQKVLSSLGVEQSFSPSGKPCHNAVMESFFSTLKKEELYRRNYHSVEEFKSYVEKYIGFYNMERPHHTLGYKTPNAYESLVFDSCIV